MSRLISGVPVHLNCNESQGPMARVRLQSQADACAPNRPVSGRRKTQINKKPASVFWRRLDAVIRLG
jgi:hypothetical protein